jgi:SM-20-related protein
MPTSISDFSFNEIQLLAAIDQLAENDWGLCQQALSSSALSQLQGLAQALFQQGHFLPARMGRGDTPLLRPEIRGDSILWLEESRHPEIHALLQDLKQTLNHKLFLNLQSFECHLAHYPPGTRYDRHFDQAPLARPSSLSGEERVITFVLYLTENWSPGDGGELHLCKSGVLVSPTPGKLILFNSQSLEHEVLLARKERWSLTGWFRRRRL